MSTDARGATPYRKIWVRFDVDEWALREPPFALWRDASKIATGHAGQALSNHWHFLAPNAIVCEPWQSDPSNIHQQTDVAGAIIDKSQWSTIDGMVERNTWKAPTDLMGVTVGPLVSATGDPHMVKTVKAGTTWAQSKDSDIASFGQVNDVGKNVILDRVSIGVQQYHANQPFVVKFVLPSNPSMPSADALLTFYFGGPADSLDPGVHQGVYALVFHPSGWVVLQERMDRGDGLGAYAFHQVDIWNAYDHYAPGLSVITWIWPHYGPTGRPHITFMTRASADARHGSGGGNGILTSYFQPGVNSEQIHVYHPRTVPSMPVTGPGPPRIDLPRSSRVPHQVSVLRHLYQALIVDDPFAIDFFPTIVNDLRIYWQTYEPDGTSVDAGLFDYGTDEELDILDSGPGFKIYRLNRGQMYYYAKFLLTPSSDGILTPVFYGYKVIRDALSGVIGPGEQTVPDDAIIRELSISGPDKDLTHETCSLTLDDPSANLSKINIRARVRTRIETEYNPSDNTLRSVLFDGFVDRADARLKGWRGNQGLSQRGAAAAYPSPQWKEFACSFSGVWRRLREKLTMQRIFLGEGQDGVTDAQGVQQPFKVTDVARAMLLWCGFAASEVDVPDSPIRFYPGSDGSGDETTLEPLTEIGDAVASMLHDYLGWFLVWDGNAGVNGMMRAVEPPPLPGPYTPLAVFTLDGAGAGKLQMRPESYGSTGWYATQPGGPGTDVNIPTAPIRRKTFQTHVKPPEANAVHVTGTGELLPNKNGQYQLNQWAWNPRSYNFFVDGEGNAVDTADPNDPDYLGEFIPLVVVNTSLSHQHAVDIVTRRLFDAACHAQKWAMFDAPLVLVIDPNDENQRSPRPLRYYDAVGITSGGVTTTWIVRSANPYLLRGKDAYSFAHYELLFVG